jgi:signal transduction histidine kinase
MAFNDLISWFAGGRDGYMTLIHCMNHDTPWIIITVALDVLVATGYALIALHWRKNEAQLREGAAKTALSDMKNIFVFCGICGYLFIPIKMFWPAWRLYDIFLAVLAIYTWKYAWGARGLKVVYNALGNTEKMAQDLRETRAEAERKTFFLNAISHDLRTPLNGLVLHGDLAQMNLEVGDLGSLRESLGEIKACAKATTELLDSLLELGRVDWSPDSNVVEDFELAPLAESLLDRSRTLANQKGLALRMAVPCGLHLRTDRFKLERILGNLVNNSLKFTHSGAIELIASATDEGVTIDVVDTGEGISPEHLPRLFEEFYQVHNRERDRKKGFGLGLAIARRLAHQLGGDLSAESTVGQGSRFRIALPDAVAPGFAESEDGPESSSGLAAAASPLAG